MVELEFERGVLKFRIKFRILPILWLPVGKTGCVLLSKRTAICRAVKYVNKEVGTLRRGVILEKSSNYRDRETVLVVSIAVVEVFQRIREWQEL